MSRGRVFDELKVIDPLLLQRELTRRAAADPDRSEHWNGRDSAAPGLTARRCARRRRVGRLVGAFRSSRARTEPLSSAGDESDRRYPRRSVGAGGSYAGARPTLGGSSGGSRGATRPCRSSNEAGRGTERAPGPPAPPRALPDRPMRTGRSSGPLPSRALSCRLTLPPGSPSLTRSRDRRGQKPSDRRRTARTPPERHQQQARREA